jgi:hypothetical protein
MCKAILTDDEVEEAIADFIRKKRGNSRVKIREVVWREITSTVRTLQVDYDLPDVIDVDFTEVEARVYAALEQRA